MQNHSKTSGWHDENMQSLFLSDFSFGTGRLPLLIYILWKSNNPSCFEIQLNPFSITFLNVCRVLFYGSHQSIVTSALWIINIINCVIFWGRNFVNTQKIYGQHLTHWLEQNMTLTNSQKFVLQRLLTQEHH